MMKQIYMDNAATTPVKPEVLEAMLPYFTEKYANPSPIYGIAHENKQAVEKARMQIASVLNADPKEIYFTVGGTESDNWALKGVAFANRSRGNHIITSKIEHHAVLHTCQYLEKQGFDVTYLDVDEYGFVRPDDLKNAITDQTVLISIMFANNEIGTIEPIEELAAIAKEHKILFHTDAVQAIGNVRIDVKKLGIDLLSMSAHKFNGPKGMGVLFIRNGVKIDNLLHGGGQERRRRAGTENVPGIVGMGKAIELAYENFEEHQKKLLEIRDTLIERLLKEIPHSRLNGHPKERLPGNVNISFEFIEGESILLLLDMAGIAAASGSACNSDSLDPSHVLLATGLPHELAHGSLRLSIGDFNDISEVDYVVETIKEIVQRLRDLSPLYDHYLKGEK